MWQQIHCILKHLLLGSKYWCALFYKTVSEELLVTWKYLKFITGETNNEQKELYLHILNKTFFC